ncbi:MAG: AMP-binding protein, partial [Acidimicrobiaceae bacterium]|nr:AMP-binding protein [Acidimicrobiaceae bacterium]
MSKEVRDCLLSLVLDQWSYDQNANQFYTTETGWISRGRLEEESRKAATGMYRNGILAGDRVLIFPDRSFEFIRIYLATLRLGAVAVMANPEYTDSEVTHLVALSKPTAFWTR